LFFAKSSSFPNNLLLRFRP